MPKPIVNILKMKFKNSVQKKRATTLSRPCHLRVQFLKVANVMHDILLIVQPAVPGVCAPHFFLNFDFKE